MVKDEAHLQAASDDELNTRGLGLGVSGVLQEHKAKDRGRLFMLFAASEHERRVWVTTLKSVCDDAKVHLAGDMEARRQPPVTGVGTTGAPRGGRRGQARVAGGGAGGAVARSAASPGHSRSRST